MSSRRFTIVPEPPLSPVAKLQLALDLSTAMETIMRHRLRAEWPGDDEDAIERRLITWLQRRPGAEDGDAVGRRIPWPRAS